MEVEGILTDDARQLICWERYDEDTRTHHQRPLRDLEPDEVERVRDANGFLLQMTSQSPYQELLVSADALKDAVDAVRRHWEGPERGLPRSELRQVNLSLRSWLAAFRAFDDRTSHYLSERFGRTSEARSEFKRALSHEYDTILEYRIATQLRNASLHVADVINSIGASVREGADGAPFHRFTLGFDGPKLAERFPDMNSKVRAELAGLTEEVPLGVLVPRVLGSCTRVLAKLFVVLRAELDDACTALESLHEESVAAGGQAAGMMRWVERDEGRAIFKYEWVEVQHAWGARSMMAQAEDVLRHTGDSST